MKKFLTLLSILVAATIAAAQVTIPWSDVDKTGAQASDVGAAPSTRTINTTAPLTGGGNLSADRTLSISTATTSATGVVQLATDAEAIAGTSTTKPAPVSSTDKQIQSYTNLRAGFPLLISDGATSYRSEVLYGTARLNFAGAAVITWAGWVYVPTANPTVNALLFVTGASTTLGVSQDNSLQGYIYTDGSLVFRQYGTSGGTNFRYVSWPGFRGAYPGQWVFLTVSFINGTTSPTVLVNNTDVSSNFSLVTGGTPPAWLNSATVTTYICQGYNWPAGPAPIGDWGNATLSSDDRTYILRTHRMPLWWYKGGSQTPLYTSNFSTSVDGWTNDGTASTVNYSASNLDIVGTSGAARAAKSFTYGYGKYRINFTIVAGTILSLNMGSVQLTGGPFSAGSYSIEVICNPSVSPLRFYVPIDGSTNSITGITVTPLGSLGSPIQGPDGYVLDGSRGSPATIGTLTGMSWDKPVPVGTRYGITKTYAHTDISSTAATTQAITLPANWALREIQRNVTTTFDSGITLSFGVSGTPGKFASAVDVATGGLATTTSSATAPQSSTAGTTVYVQKSGATTQGAASVTYVVEKEY